MWQNPIRHEQRYGKQGVKKNADEDALFERMVHGMPPLWEERSGMPHAQGLPLGRT